MEGAVLKPSIVIDMRKKRIRIHRHTLHALGDPDFVVLIINPEEHTLGVKCSMLDDKLAHRVHKSNIRKKDCYELYSKRLMTALHELCPGWGDRECYRIEGEIITEEKMAVFSMRDFARLER
jgi:hypothetical protein